MRIECEGVLFDNDGVLVDSRAQGAQAWLQLVDEFGIEVDDILSEMMGVRAIDTLNRFLAPDRAAQAEARLEDLEVELSSTTQPIPGARLLLGRLPPGAWAIVTSATRRLANARWENAGIVAPPETVSAEEVSKGKPDPEPFLAGARLLGIDPTRCVVFEDSPSGGAAGAAAGATVIAVGNTPWAIEPSARVKDLTEVTVALTDGGGFALVLLDARSGRR